MRAGKLSESMLIRSVLKEIKVHNDDAIVRSGIGVDGAIVKTESETAVTTTTVTLSSGDYGIIGVNRVINDLAAMGAKATFITANITMPTKFDEKILKTIMRQIESVVSKHNVTLVAGHTEITDAVNEPVVSFTGIGKKIVENIQPYKVKCGQQIVMTKWAGMEGAYIAINKKRAQVYERFSAQMLSFVENVPDYISVVDEARIALSNGATYMHNLSNGGILNALWELSVFGNTGLTVDFTKIPMRQEIIEICELLELNPYRLLSGGSMLIVTDDGDALCEKLIEEEIPAVVIGTLTDSNDKILINKEEIRYLDVQSRDDLWWLFDGRKI